MDNNLYLRELKGHKNHIDKLKFEFCLEITAETDSSNRLQTDKIYDVCYDTGDKVIQCGRHNDIFKLWLQWRSKVSPVVRTPPNTNASRKFQLFFFIKLTSRYSTHMYSHSYERTKTSFASKTRTYTHTN
jgi:hypothetical protein